MTGETDRPTIEIAEDGRTVASADVHDSADAGVVRAELHVESGQLPSGTRSRLVDAVLDSPASDKAEKLIATMPLGDTEMLDRLRERGDGVEARAAGATKIVEARLPSTD